MQAKNLLTTSEDQGVKGWPSRLLRCPAKVGPAPTAHGPWTPAGGNAPRRADDMLAKIMYYDQMYLAQDCKEESPRQNSSTPVTMTRGSAQLPEVPMEKGLAFRMGLEVPGVEPF